MNVYSRLSFLCFKIVMCTVLFGIYSLLNRENRWELSKICTHTPDIKLMLLNMFVRALPYHVYQVKINQI